MKVSAVAVAGAVLVAALGGTGLVLGQTSPSTASTASGPGQVSVVGAYVRAPVPPTKLAAGYFTVYNSTSAPDRLLSVQTGAGASAVLHVVNAGGGMAAMTHTGIDIPAHGRFTLTTGQSHLMIGQLFGPVVAGQNVDISVQFRKAGTVTVVAPVIAVGAPVPASAAGSPSGSSDTTMNMSGDH